MGEVRAGDFKLTCQDVINYSKNIVADRMVYEHLQQHAHVVVNTGRHGINVVLVIIDTCQKTQFIVT